MGCTSCFRFWPEGCDRARQTVPKFSGIGLRQCFIRFLFDQLGSGQFAKAAHLESPLFSCFQMF